MSQEPSYVEVANQALAGSIPVVHGMGVRVVELSAGHVVTEVPLEGNSNHVGTMYAGVLFTVAEVLGGLIGIASFDAARFYPVVKDVQIRYRRPATSRVRASADLDAATIMDVLATATEQGKADFALDATLTDEGGTVVATTHGTYQLRAHGA